MTALSRSTIMKRECFMHSRFIVINDGENSSISMKNDGG